MHVLYVSSHGNKCMQRTTLYWTGVGEGTFSVKVLYWAKGGVEV